MMTSDADLAERAVELIEEARRQAATVVNMAMVYAYYGVGRMIVEEEQGGAVRAGYGQRLLKRLSKRMTAKLGGGFSPQNLANMKQFYLTYSSPRIFQTPSGKSVKGRSSKPVFALSWSHYLKLMRIEDPQERSFYEIEARENGWSLRELTRQFGGSSPRSTVRSCRPRRS